MSLTESQKQCRFNNNPTPVQRFSNVPSAAAATEMQGRKRAANRQAQMSSHREEKSS
jgi:hypothetical protein